MNPDVMNPDAMNLAVRHTPNQRRVLQELGLTPLRWRERDSNSQSSSGTIAAATSGVLLQRDGRAPAADDPLLLAILRHQPGQAVQHQTEGVRLLPVDDGDAMQIRINLSATPAADWKRQLWAFQRHCRRLVAT